MISLGLVQMGMEELLDGTRVNHQFEKSGVELKWVALANGRNFGPSVRALRFNRIFPWLEAALWHGEKR
jgi:hypothetical protein